MADAAILQAQIQMLAEQVVRLQQRPQMPRSELMIGEFAKLNRPPQFDGKDEEFGDWDFSLVSYMSGFDEMTSDEMKACARMTMDVQQREVRDCWKRAAGSLDEE